MTEHKPTLKELIAERDELLAKKEENSEVITGCRAQIEAAQARYYADRERSDPKWYVAAKTRMHYAGREDQKIAQRLSEVNRLIRVANTEQYRAKHDGTGDAIDLLRSAISLIGQALDQLREQDNKDVTHETHPPAPASALAPAKQQRLIKSFADLRSR